MQHCTTVQVAARAREAAPPSAPPRPQEEAGSLAERLQQAEKNFHETIRLEREARMLRITELHQQDNEKDI